MQPRDFAQRFDSTKKKLLNFKGFFENIVEYFTCEVSSPLLLALWTLGKTVVVWIDLTGFAEQAYLGRVDFARALEVGSVRVATVAQVAFAIVAVIVMVVVTVVASATFDLVSVGSFV